MAESKYTRTCECCGTEFAAKTPTKRFCSNSCRDKQRNLVPSIDAVCKHCGKHFKAKRRVYSTFCSKSCSSLFMHKNTNYNLINEIKSLRNLCSKHLYNIQILIEIASLLRIKKRNKKIYSAKAGIKKHKLCLQCNKRFVYIRTKGGSPDHCSDKCRKESKKRTAKKFSRIAKAKRRAIYRSVEADNIDPFDVFDRDGWRCHICGRKTPKSKRGSHADNAPELDHIVPISKGGKHTFSNVACSCRKCNQIKSDKPFGQLNLGAM